MNEQTQTLQIYRDGNIDKSFYRKQQAKSALRFAVRNTIRGISATFDVLDELVIEYQKL